jgi:hypothetical protein
VTVPSSSEPRANFYTNGRAADAPVGIQNAWGPPAASPDYWLQFDQVEAMATARPAPTLGEVAFEARLKQQRHVVDQNAFFHRGNDFFELAPNHWMSQFRKLREPRTI